MPLEWQGRLANGLTFNFTGAPHGKRKRRSVSGNGAADLAQMFMFDALVTALHHTGNLSLVLPPRDNAAPRAVKFGLHLGWRLELFSLGQTRIHRLTFRLLTL